MSQTLVRPKVVDVRVDVHDLRGAPALPVPRPVLHDPSGLRGRRLRALSRGVIGLLVAWLAGLLLAGLGLVPAAMIPLGSLVAAPAPKALMTMTSGPDSAAAGRPGSSSSIGVAVQIAAERLAPPAGPPFAGDVMPGGRHHWRRASGAGAGVTPFVGDDDLPTVSVTQPRGSAPAPPAGASNPQAPAATGASPGNAPASGGSPAASAPAQQPSGAGPATDSATTSDSAAPGSSDSAPARADGASPGASGTAPGRTADTPAPASASNGGNANANNANANTNANANANANNGGSANANAGSGNGQGRGRTDAAS